jgi:acetate kinase
LRILVVNAGSSSLKLRLLDGSDNVVASADLPPPGAAAADTAVREWLESCGPVDAAGHRIVHGGTDFRSPVLVDAEVRKRLVALTDLAPLHQPKSLDGLNAVESALPDLPAVACFDTAFHATLPEDAATLALPAAWRQRWALRKYGFHGLSHAYVSRRAAELTGGASRRLVSCHLGAGASLAAVLDGESVETTMGFTPLDGLVMATRSGSVDPGLVLWLQTHGGMTADQVTAGLENQSGLLGLAGTADTREVEARAAAGDEHAMLALDVFVHRLRREVAAMAAALGGLDTLAFTGGIGENSAQVRARTMDGLGFLGVTYDAARNQAARSDADREISAKDSAVRTFVIPAREDLEIARQVREVLD